MSQPLTASSRRGNSELIYYLAGALQKSDIVKIEQYQIKAICCVPRGTLIDGERVDKRLTLRLHTPYWFFGVCFGDRDLITVKVDEVLRIKAEMEMETEGEVVVFGGYPMLSTE